MFRKYNHVMRLDNVDIEGLLDQDVVTVSYKIDGTNTSVFWNEETDKISAGSRTREISLDNDNGGFFSWLMSDEGEAPFLREFVENHKNFIIYGEWLGKTKFLGAIKDYNKDALGHLWIFDVFDISTGEYLPEILWRMLLTRDYGSGYPYMIPFVTVENPTLGKLLEVAQDNHFLLDTANHVGEGIVIRSQNYRNRYGRYEMGKIVLDDFKQKKSKPKPVATSGQVEENIIVNFVTDAELSKAIAKVETEVDDKFNNSNSKHIGRYLNEVWEGAILDEMKTILKKNKMPTIDFKLLRRFCDDRAKEYINL